MKKAVLIFLLIPVLFGCTNFLISDGASSDKLTNFEYLWGDINNRYAYFTEKDIDWAAVHDSYKPLVSNDMTDEDFFVLMGNMLEILRDGHVNLFSPYGTSYYSIYEGNEQNHNTFDLERYYLDQDSDDLKTSILDSTMSFRVLRDYYRSDLPFQIFVVGSTRKIAYISYASFSDSTSLIDYVLTRCQEYEVDGYILDLRSNGGGSLYNDFVLMSRVVTAKNYVYNKMRKRRDSSSFVDEGENYIYPVRDESCEAYNSTGVSFPDKPIRVLTNKGCYSATNFFATMVRSVYAQGGADIKLVGDYTGGGSGLPIYAQLPNGWEYRFSYDKVYIPASYVDADEVDKGNLDDNMFQSEGFHTEDGVPPHIYVVQSYNDTLLNSDTILEAGIADIVN